MQFIIQFYMKIILSNTGNIRVIWSFFRVTSVAVEKKKVMHILRVFLLRYPVQFLSSVDYFTYITSCVFYYIFSLNRFLAIVCRQVCRLFVFTLRLENNT